MWGLSFNLIAHFPLNIFYKKNKIHKKYKINCFLVIDESDSFLPNYLIAPRHQFSLENQAK